MTEAAAVTQTAEEVSKALAQATPAVGEAKADVKAPAQGDPGAEQDSNPFAEEDAAMAARAAALAKEQEDAAKASGTGETATGDVAGAADVDSAAKAKADAAVAAAASAATNPQTQAFIALRKKVSDLSGALLIKEGENRALKALVDPTRAGAEATGDLPANETLPTAEEAIATIEAECEALAAKVDAGQLTMVEYTKQVNALRKQERELILAEAGAMAEAAAANVKPANDLGLDTATNALIADYQILTKLTKAQLDPIAELAYSQLEMEGHPIIAETPTETLRLRQRIADLAEELYDKPAYQARLAKTAKAAPPANALGQPAPGNVRVLPTAEQRAEKLAMAASMPLEVGSVGAGAPGGELSDAQIQAALSGNEDQRIAFMQSHPQLVARVLGPGYRAAR